MFIKKKSVLLFLIPGLVFLAVFYIIPFAGGIRYSLLDGSKEQHYIGLDNYLSVWKNQMFQIGFRNTIELSAICAPLLWLLAYLLAAALTSIAPKGAAIRSTVLLPYIAPSSAILLIWLVLFDYGGPANRIVQGMTGSKVMWLESSMLRVPIILMFLWKNLGFCTIIFMAALQSVPQSLYEYAALEGAGFTTRMFRIALPLILPSAFLVLILAWINAFRIFKEVYFIAGAYPDRSVYTLQHFMNNMFSRMNYQYVTASAYIFAFFVLIVFGILFILQRRAVRSML